MKRLLTKALAWLLFFSLIPESGILYSARLGALRAISSARAEAMPLPEAYSLPEQSVSGEMQAGVWRYALREGDGYAVITGYDGEARGELEIPAAVNGIDVVGIASRALEIDGLELIRLNSNVLWMAPDAFGQEKPAIRALSGSYALWWADQHGFETVNASDGEFVPGVLDFSDAPEGRVRIPSEDKLIFGELEARRVEEGSVIWLTDERDLQHYYRVTDLTEADGYVVAEVEQPEIRDVVVNMSYEGSVVINAGDIIPAPGVTVSGTDGLTARDLYEDHAVENIEIHQKIYPGLDENSIDLRLKSFQKANYRYEIVDGEIIYAETSMDEVYDITIGFEAVHTLTDALPDWTETKEKVLFDAVLAKAKIPVSVFYAEIEIGFLLEVDGYIGGRWRVEKTTAQVYDFEKDEWVILYHDEENTPSFDCTVEGKLGLKVGVNIGLLCLVKFMGVSGEAGVKIKASFNSNKNKSECMPLSVVPYVKLEFYLGVWGGDTLGIKAILEESETEFDGILWHVGFGGEHPASECPWQDVTEVIFDTRTEYILDRVNIRIGEPMPGKPEYSLPANENCGAFRGWTTDISGTEPNWFFDDENCRVKGPMTLYALWENEITVTFETFGGDAVASQRAPVGGYVSEPKEPAKKDVYFMHWYTLTEQSYSKRWFFDQSVVSEDMTLYAMWSDGESTLTGVQHAFCIGDPTVFEWNFDKVQTGADCFEYTIVKFEGEDIGVNITGIREDVTNVLISETFKVPYEDEEGKLSYRILPVVSIQSHALRSPDLQKIVIRLPDVTLNTSSMFRDCTSLICADLSGTKINDVGDYMFRECYSLRCAILPKGVSVIGSAAFESTSLKEVWLPEGITAIESYAFENCRKLAEVYLPDSLETLGLYSRYNGPFLGCTGLRRISIGGLDTIECGMFRTGSTVLDELIIRGSVREIGSDAFNSEMNYRDEDDRLIRNRNGYDVSRGRAKLIIEDGVETIKSEAFLNCNIFGEIVLPDSLKEIGSYAFAFCGGIREIDLPDALPEIGSHAFQSCGRLQSVTISDQTKVIGVEAFAYCGSLKQLDLGNGVQKIHSQAFAFCSSLEDIYIPDSVTYIGTSSYRGPFVGCDSVRHISIGGVETVTSGMLRTGSRVLEDVTIRGTVKTIGGSAFSSSEPYGDYGELSDANGFDGSDLSVCVYIEEGVETIGGGAFYECTGITKVVFPRTIKTIGDFAFCRCTRMENYSIVFAEGLESIGEYAFLDVDQLETLHIPGSCKTIGKGAFRSCDWLKNLLLREGVETIGVEAFHNCGKLEEVYLPDSIRTLGTTRYEGPFMGCKSLRRLSVGGLAEIKSGNLRTGSTVLEELVIRGTVQKIGDNAFDSRYSIKDSYDQVNRNGYDSSASSARLVIEEGVESIGDYAFRSCDIFTEIILPDSVVSIGDCAFWGCRRFSKIDLPAELTSMGSSAFNSCHSLLEITFPEKLSYIPEYAFHYCSRLRKATIPGTVEEIWTDAFSACVTLKELTIGEGVQSIYRYAFEDCSALEELRIPSSITGIGLNECIGPFTGCTSLRRLEINGPSKITCGMFRTGSKVVEEVVIGGNVQKIDESAFDSRWNYEEGSFDDEEYNGYNTRETSARLVIGEGVKSIGENAFNNCDVFTEIVLSSTLTNLGAGVFAGCDRVEHMRVNTPYLELYTNSLPAVSLSSLKVYVPAENASMLTWLTNKGYTCVTDGEVSFALTLDANGGVFDDGLETQTMNAVWENALPALEVPQNGEQRFSGWYVDEACAQPMLLTRMPARNVTLYAGWNIDCYALTLELCGGVLDGKLNFYAKAGEKPVETLVPEREEYCFTGWYSDEACTKPFSGTMPASELTLYAGWAETAVYADYAFTESGAILTDYYLVEYESTEVWLPETVNGVPVVGIADYAFDGLAVTKLHLPSGLTELSSYALSGMEELQAISVAAGNPSFAAKNGVLYSRDLTTLLWYPAQAASTCVLPASVRHIGDRAFAESKLRSIVLGEGIESIGANAFAGTMLHSVDFPATLASVGYEAFYGCTGLYIIRADATLNEIGERAFEGCGSPMMIYGPLEECAISRYAQQYNHMYNYYTLTLTYQEGKTAKRVNQAGLAMVLPSAVAMGENAEFTGWYTDEACTSAWEGNMPQSNLTLYAGSSPVYAYENVQIAEETETTDETTGETTVTVTTRTVLKLTQYLSSRAEAVVPASIGGVKVEQIASGCFGEQVTRVQIPDEVKLIEENAFANADVTIVCSVGSAAHAYVQANGQTARQPEYQVAFMTNGGAQIAAVKAAQGSRLELPVPVRSGCEPAGWYLDEALTELAAVDENGFWTLPGYDTVLYAAWTVTDESLAAPAFTYEQQKETIIVTGLADGVTELVIPETLHGLPVAAVKASAFRAEKQLVSVRIPGTIANIPENAFRNCTSLEQVILSEGVQTISAGAFRGCSALTKIILPDTVNAVGAEAFADSGLAEIRLGARLSQLADDALNGCGKLEKIEVAESNAVFESKSGVLYHSANHELVKYPAGRKDEEYAVDSSCTSIGAHAFSGAENLKRVTLHDQVSRLGEEAFRGCTSLEQLPVFSCEQPVVIPANAFAECGALTAVTIPSCVAAIGQYAFANCRRLETAFIPDTVLSIGNNAFGHNVTLEGTAGSAAEAYANSNGLLFVDPASTVLPQSVSISGSEGMLKRGQTQQLTVSLLPENATLTEISWYSTDERIVRVSETGLIRAIGGGEAAVGVRTANGLSAEVTVEVDPTVEAEQILMDVSETTIGTDETLQLSVSFVPANTTHQTAVWTSNDENVAIVDENGLVTPVGAGTAVITAAAYDGPTAVCVVSVYQIVEQLVLTGAGSCQVFEKGDTISLTAEIHPENARDQTVVFTSSDINVASVDENGEVAFVNSGYVTITATAADRGFVSDSLTLECKPSFVMVLPEGLQTIQTEAFAGSAAECIVIPQNAVSIGSKAFAECSSLCKVIIPESVTEIADDAFKDSRRVTICAPLDSEAHRFAQTNGISFIAIE